MKKIMILDVLILLVLFVFSACGTVPAADTETPESSKFDAGETEKAEEAVISQNTAGMQPPQWVVDGGGSISSSEERCVVGKVSCTQNAEDYSNLDMEAFDKARIKFCRSTVSVDIDTASDTTVTRMSRCVIPATEKRDVWKSADGTVYVLVCAERNEIDDVYEDEKEEIEETDENNETDNQ